MRASHTRVTDNTYLGEITLHRSMAISLSNLMAVERLRWSQVLLLRQDMASWNESKEGSDVGVFGVEKAPEKE